MEAVVRVLRSPERSVPERPVPERSVQAHSTGTTDRPVHGASKDGWPGEVPDRAKGPYVR